MFKRLSTAAIAVLLVTQVAPAEARPYSGYDGRNYGEFKNAPNYGRPENSEKASEKKGPHSAGGKAAKAVAKGNRKGLTPAALALLARIENEFGPVTVISGYRPGARIAGSGRISRHASGNAIDFEAGNRKAAIVKWLVANHKSGGTMTYGGMSHVHVDIGQHFVSVAGGSGRRASNSGYSNRRAARYAQRAYSGYARSYAYEGRRYSSDRYAGDYRRGYAALY